MITLESISTFLVIISVILLSIPKIQGLYVMILAQVGWSLFALCEEDHWFFLLQSLFLLLINSIAIRNWRKKHVG